MRVRTFRGENMPSVLARIKAEMGVEAVILGSQSVIEDGRPVCEIMAAVDDAGASPEPSGRAPGKQGPAGHGNGDGAETREAALPPTMEDMLREWDELKRHMLALVKPRCDLGRLTPRQRLALTHLEKEGVEDDILLTLYRDIVDRGETQVMPALSRLVTMRPFASDAWPQTVHVLAGPHGAGKTTTLLRLALAQRKLHPSARIVLANADGEHGKGRLLLKHYAELSGFAYRDLTCPEDLTDMTARAEAGDRVFVDMPGLRPGQTLAERLTALGLSGRADTAVHLVLSPTLAPAQITHFLRLYRSDMPGGLVFTKLDEACSFGGLVNTAARTGLPLVALCHGPDLKQCLTADFGGAAWRLVFKRVLPEAGSPDTQARPAGPDNHQCKKA